VNTTQIKHSSRVERIGSSDYGHVRGVCSCGWVSPLYPRRTAEGRVLAERDADRHVTAATGA
jgi:hypothetical protein